MPKLEKLPSLILMLISDITLQLHFIYYFFYAFFRHKVPVANSTMPKINEKKKMLELSSHEIFSLHLKNVFFKLTNRLSSIWFFAHAKLFLMGSSWICWKSISAEKGFGRKSSPNSFPEKYWIGRFVMSCSQRAQYMFL